MKIKFLFATLLAAITFASCSNDDGTNVVPAGQPAKMSVTIKQPTRVRAIGAAATTDQTITTFTVWIFNADGTLAATATASDGSDKIENIEVTTSATDAYVIANCDQSTVTGITTKQALLDYVGNLANTANQTAARWATGKNATALTFTPADGTYEGSATIALDFIAARITVKIVNGMTGYDATAEDGSLVLEKVAVLNAGGTSKLFGTSLIPATKTWISGIADNSFEYWPAANVTVDGTLLSNDIPADDFTTTYHYYAFENDATSPENSPTIVTLVGEYAGAKTYFPVHLAPYETFKTGDVADGVKRGHSYDITITLKTDPTIGGGEGGGGETDPTKPAVAKAKFDVEISINDWIPVTLEKEF